MVVAVGHYVDGLQLPIFRNFVGEFLHDDGLFFAGYFPHSFRFACPGDMFGIALVALRRRGICAFILRSTLSHDDFA